MPNPQVENGFIRIATEFYSALTATRISGEERQLFDVIILKTWGYHKIWDFIALSQFTKLTGIKKSNVVRGLKKLVERNMVLKKDNSYPIKYRIQKDYMKWVRYSKKNTGTQKRESGVLNIDNQGYSKKRHTKDTITKDTITKDIKGNLKKTNKEIYDEAKREFLAEG